MSDRDSVVGIAIRHGLDCRGEIFHALPNRPWGLPSVLYIKY